MQFPAGHPDGRILQFLLYLRSSPADNMYAHPLDTVVFYDVNTDTVKNFACYGRQEGQQVRGDGTYLRCQQLHCQKLGLLRAAGGAAGGVALNPGAGALTRVQADPALRVFELLLTYPPFPRSAPTGPMLLMVSAPLKFKFSLARCRLQVPSPKHPFPPHPPGLGSCVPPFPACFLPQQQSPTRSWRAEVTGAVEGY